eukprot:jgi/Botrbrau1/18151/Bobra.53_1s0022.2
MRVAHAAFSSETRISVLQTRQRAWKSETILQAGYPVLPSATRRRTTQRLQRVVRRSDGLSFSLITDEISGTSAFSGLAEEVVREASFVQERFGPVVRFCMSLKVLPGRKNVWEEIRH